MSTDTLNVAGIAVSPHHYIDGQRVASDMRFDLHSPIDQALLGRIGEGSPAHVDAAVSAAARAFPAWSALTAAEEIVSSISWMVSSEKIQASLRS